MAADGDIKTHEATYHKVIGWMKYGSVIVFVIALVMLYVISAK